MENNENSSQITAKINFADKAEKWVNDPKSLPIVGLVIVVISLLMMSQWGNSLG